MLRPQKAGKAGASAGVVPLSLSSLLLAFVSYGAESWRVPAQKKVASQLKSVQQELRELQERRDEESQESRHHIESLSGQVGTLREAFSTLSDVLVDEIGLSLSLSLFSLSLDLSLS